MGGSDAVLSHLLPKRLVRRNMIKVVKWLELDILAEHVALEPVWQSSKQLVGHMLASRHPKDVVKLLQRALLGLRHPKEDHDESSYVQKAREGGESVTPVKNKTRRERRTHA